MIASLLASIQLFAAADPALCLRDLQQVRERPFDLRAACAPLSFQPEVPVTCHFESFRFRLEPYSRNASFVQIMLNFPSFFSDATVTNHDRGLDVYLQVR